MGSPLKGDILHCVVRDLDKKHSFLETHFEWVPSPPSCERVGHRNMVDSVLLSERGLDGSEAKPWVERDVGNMDGMVILHQHQGSQDSSDSGSLPPTYSRLPPDGHEFPEDYVDPSLHGFHDFAKNNIHEQEYLSRKSSASSTASLDRHDLKMTISGKKYATIDDKKSGVRAKIAMFSNDNSKTSQSKPTLGKFQSSEDVGKVSVGGSGSLTRAHTHSDVRYDEGLKKQGSQLSLKLNTENRSEGSGPVHKGKDFSNLKPQNKSTSFRSMINVSSSQDPTSPQDDKAFSVGDLTKSTDTLIRSHENEHVIWEETSTNLNEKPRKNPPPSISNRSQSLNEIGKSQKVHKQHQDMGTQGRSRSSNIIVQNEQGRKSSMTVLIEQRRRSTMSKLKGLVIPESVTESNSVNHSSKQKSSVNEKHSVISNKVSGALPNPPWKEKNESDEFPKYSPAFKRKPFTVYNTKNARPLSREGQNESERSMSPRSPQDKAECRLNIQNLSKKQPNEQLAYKPPIGKKNSDEGLPNSPTGLKTEDSDNDSAVSSGRSSLSGRSSSPPQSPKAIRNELREKMQNNKNSNIDMNPRVLKKNSVEAINRQNVINACKKSSATPINDINAAFTKEELKNAEIAEPPLETSSPRNNRTCGRPASRSSSFTIAERKKSFESQQSESSSSRRGSNSSQGSLSRRSSRDAFETNTNSRRSSREVMEEVNSRRSSRVTTPTGNSNYPDSILDIEEKVAYMSDVVDRASSATPTERRSLSRTNSIASERSTYSSRSSRNSSIVSEKPPFARNSSIMSKDSAISEDISKEAEVRDKKLPEENLNKKSSNTTMSANGPN